MALESPHDLPRPSYLPYHSSTTLSLPLHGSRGPSDVQVRHSQPWFWLFWLFPLHGICCLHMTSGELLRLLQLVACVSPLSVPHCPIMKQFSPPHPYSCTTHLPCPSLYFLSSIVHIASDMLCLLWLFIIYLIPLESKYYGLGIFVFFSWHMPSTQIVSGTKQAFNKYVSTKWCWKLLNGGRGWDEDIWIEFWVIRGLLWKDLG